MGEHEGRDDGGAVQRAAGGAAGPDQARPVVEVHVSLEDLKPFSVLRDVIVFGASCRWWDCADNVGRNADGVPCCPHCGGTLLQTTASEWDLAIEVWRAEGYPGYAAMIRWSRGKCFPNAAVMRAAYIADCGAGYAVPVASYSVVKAWIARTERQNETKGTAGPAANGPA